jgi:hypothetical protein
MPETHRSRHSAAALSVPVSPTCQKYFIFVNGLTDVQGFPYICSQRMPAMTTIPLAGRADHPISPLTLAERTPPSRARCVFLLRTPCVCTLWLRSPLERSHTFFQPRTTSLHRPSRRLLWHSRGCDRRSGLLTHPCARRMADMTVAALLTHVIIGIFLIVDVT